MKVLRFQACSSRKPSRLRGLSSAPPPDLGIVTFVNTAKVKPKRHPGYCYIRAGFNVCGETKGGLLALQLIPDAMPEPLQAQQFRAGPLFEMAQS